MFRFVAAALFLIFLVAGCYQEARAPKPELRPPEQQENQKEKPNTEFKKLHYVIYEEGRLKWDIFAEEAKIYKGKKIKLSQLRVCANPEKGFCISAKRGSYDPEDGRFTFKGRVVLDAGKKGKLYTSVLKYFPKKDILETEAPVTIKNEGMLIEGRGFSYDVKTGTMKVLKRTKVRVDA
ncbi:MAG: LPS export ABC transporter periplasmic protein LptC [Thermodesulfobacteria bacterium]|nr:LPS export ABC transporter periplasmic protein LptC [Thermodesulfobacteriota bacterium]